MGVLIINAETLAEQETGQLQDVLLAGGRVAWMSSPRDATERIVSATASVPREATEVMSAIASDEGSAFRGEQLDEIIDADGGGTSFMECEASAREQLEEIIDADGGALLPGLHDHHIHLLSLAESLRSVDVSQVADEGQLRSRIRASADDAADRRTDESWIRAVGYHESAAGDLTKHDLDEIVRNRPLRIQHASGAMWMFNTLGMELLGISETTPGAELDEAGRTTGRLFREDELLRSGLGPPESHDAEPHAAASEATASSGDSQMAKGLTEVGIMLSSFGVTGVTDATPGYGDAEVGFFRNMAEAGVIPQRLTLMPSVERIIADASPPKNSAPQSTPAISAEAVSTEMPMPHVSFGPHKIILSDHALPAFSEVADEVRAAHEAGRPVAVHSVTRASLALLVAVLNDVGSLEGDRVEHASVAPPELVAELQRHKVRVVVQPHFIAERGDRYLKEVESDDLPWLYRCQGFLEAGLRVAGGTDAPFGKPNPWLAMWAAVKRETQSGEQVIAPQERVAAAQARDLFLSPLDDPGGKPRRVSEGMAGDLCLLHEPWREVARSMPENPVRTVWIRGGRQ